MTRRRKRLLVPTLVALAFLSPTLALAQPKGPALLSAAERHEPNPGCLFQFWSRLTALWSENGSGLEPNGAPRPTSGLPAEPTATISGDNGSGLDPNG